MGSTTQYWTPAWGALERYWKPRCPSRAAAGGMSGTLHLAQALSNRGRRGPKNDFRDAARLVKRLVSRKIVLSFVPGGVRYEERGPGGSEKSRQRRMARMIRKLRILGYRVERLAHPT